MKSLLSLLILVLVGTKSYSQSDIGFQWQKCYGSTADDLLVDFQQTSDSGYIMAGHSNSSYIVSGGRVGLMNYPAASGRGIILLVE